MNITDIIQEQVKVLFTQIHKEHFPITKETENQNPFSLLHKLLEELGYIADSTIKTLTSDQLANYQILVLVGTELSGKNNSERVELTPEEIDVIQQFVDDGGGLLLISNSETMINPPVGLNEIAAIADIQFHEYHNYPPTFIQRFLPHYITANVTKVIVDEIRKIASLKVGNKANLLATTRATQQPVLASANVKDGRVVGIGDVCWLMDYLLERYNNKQLATNTFRWLAGHNAIDITQVVIPETVTWGKTEPVILRLSNHHAETRPEVECVLESNVDAIISEPIRKRCSIPPNTTISRHWNVHPQILGKQHLRLAIYIDGHKPLFFDKLPEMRCLAPGYFTLITKDKTGKRETTFKTGEYFTIESAFHWTTELEPLPYQLELELNSGLVEREHKREHGIDQWDIQATTSGTHKVTVRFAEPETGQSLSAVVKISSSTDDRLAEIYTAYVDPLEAEIVGRLRQVDKALSSGLILEQPFKILSPENFIKEVYTEDTIFWLQDLLIAAREELWYNITLLDIFTTHISPTYIYKLGSFIPYDPSLASHLAKLHRKQRRYIESTLLCSEESQEIQIKQNVAAYLLHEKFGHGFFYTQTRLGQQIAILQLHGLLEKQVPQRYKHYQKVCEIIDDSAIIANEGFAAWLEITFLARLDHDVRQAVDFRHHLLIQETTGLYQRERTSDFFKTFEPRFDSRYREGFEYLDFISRTFNIRCAVQLFLMATNIDLGISEENGSLQFKFAPEFMISQLLNEEIHTWHSHLRLRNITDFLYQYINDAKKIVHKQYCKIDCRYADCPLKEFIIESLPLISNK